MRTARRRLFAIFIGSIGLTGAGCNEKRYNDAVAAASGNRPDQARATTAIAPTSPTPSTSGSTNNATADAPDTKPVMADGKSAGAGSSEADPTGLPVYPGATRVSGSLPPEGRISGDTVTTAVYETSATTDTVLAFYRDRMPSAESGNGSEAGAVEQTLSETEGREGLRRVAISAANGTTRIELMHLSSPALPVTSKTSTGATPPAPGTFGSPNSGTTPGASPTAKTPTAPDRNDSPASSTPSDGTSLPSHFRPGR